MKRYMNAALLYAVLAMAGGVFYREFTKFTGFTAKTTLSVIHTHYFMLGMAVFLLLLLLEKNFSFGEHFSIPVRIGSRIGRYYYIEQKKHTGKGLQKILSMNYQHFTETLEKKRVEIISNDVKIYTGRVCARAFGQLTVITDIAVPQPISIMEDNTDGDD